MTEQNLETADEAQSKTRRRLKLTIAVLAGVLVVLMGVLAWSVYIAPERDAQAALDSVAASQGPIAALNTGLVTYEGQKLESANAEQKGLAQGDELTTPPAFIFTNGKKSADREVLSLYFDFSDQRSRDALIANSISLRALVESGKVELQLHPLFGGRAYSMYAAEALSEVFAADSDLAWDSLMVLLRNAPVLSATDSNDEMIQGIVSGLTAEGVTAVDGESIKNGTFATWLLSIGNDSRLSGAVAPKLPYILVGDRPLNLSADQLNDPDAFKRAVLRELSR